MAFPWKYAQNQFLRVSGTSRRVLLRVSRDHTAKLVSKLNQGADPVLQTCLDRTLPLEDAYELAIIDWEIKSGTRKGQTDVFEELLDELSGERIRTWDVTIQNTFPQGSQQHTQLLPNGRRPFQSGPRDDRITAVRTLAIGLEAFAELSTLQETVDSFHQMMESARNTQQGSEGDIATASEAVDVARQALAIVLYRNLGLLMDKHGGDPLQLETYYELALLRTSGGGPALPDPPAGGEPTTETFQVNYTQSGPTTLTGWFRMPDDGSIDPAEVTQVRFTEGGESMEWGVSLPAGSSQQVVWEGVTLDGELDEAVLLNSDGDILAEGVLDPALPDPGP